MGDKDENTKIGIMVDGEFQEIKEIPSLGEEAERNYPEDGVEWFLHPQEMTFECNVSPLQLLGVLLDRQTLISYCRSVKSNNWLRRHGMPMRRRA